MTTDEVDRQRIRQAAQPISPTWAELKPWLDDQCWPKWDGPLEDELLAEALADAGVDEPPYANRGERRAWLEYTAAALCAHPVP